MCECDEPSGFVKLRYVGNRGIRVAPKGPWRSYNLGEVYVEPERYNNSAAFPYFEYVGEACLDEVDEPWRTRLGLGPKPQSSEKVDPELIEASEADLEIIKTKGQFTPGEETTGAPNIAEALSGMDAATLRAYAIGAGVEEVNKHWSKKKLIAEILKIQ
jgi:hypothetical protein